jgi:hypothetical protein
MLPATAFIGWRIILWRRDWLIRMGLMPLMWRESMAPGACFWRPLATIGSIICGDTKREST